MDKIFTGSKTPVAGPSSRKTPDTMESEKVDGAMGGITSESLNQGEVSKGKKGTGIMGLIVRWKN
jgi:hypothetical protein